MKKMNLKYLLTISIAVLFLIIAGASAVVRLEQMVPSQKSDVIFKINPIIKTTTNNLVFCVLQTEYSTAGTQSTIENILSNKGISVVDISNAKQIYQEQILNNNSKKTTIDYYIYVEEDEISSGNKIYYYQLIDAKDYKVAFASKINTISFENLMEPFNGSSTKIDLSFIKFYKTTDNLKYNELVDLKVDDEILKESEVLISEGKSKSFPEKTKKKIKESYYLDQYAICLNLATQYLLNREFSKFNEASKLAVTIAATKVPMLSPETDYLEKLKKTASLYETAIQDSIYSSISKLSGTKKSITISNDYKNTRLQKDIQKRTKLAYSSAIVTLFKTNHTVLNIYERELIDEILSTNTNVTQKAKGQTIGTDYLLSITITSWSKPKPNVENKSETIKNKDGTVTVNNYQEYTYNNDCKITVKITNNKNSLIVGSILLEHSNRSTYRQEYSISDSGIFIELFDDGKLNDFFSKTMKW